jgi:hypothetical protein
MTRTPQSIQTFFLDFCPGPSLHNTAAATSLTSFINVSGQPYSRKRWPKKISDEIVHALPIRSFGRFFRVFFG